MQTQSGAEGASVSEIGVVHLIRRRNGLKPFQRFMETYRAHPTGVEHDLLLVFKGFRSENQSKEYEPMLTGIPHRRLYVSDSGYDLGAYLKAARHFDYTYYCFLNSFSQIRCSNWLAYLYRALMIPGVGVAGATGSFESFSANSRWCDQKLKSLSVTGRVRFLAAHFASAPTLAQGFLRFSAWILRSLGIWNIARFFPGFPNPHIRTNAFMVSRQVLARLRAGPMWFKFATYMLESGYESVTNQILAGGLRPVIVDSKGAVYERAEWPCSKTFRHSNQENLMVNDNQTEAYANADPEYREELSCRAWGGHGDQGSSQ
jgi:hypothetical protein